MSLEDDLATLNINVDVRNPQPLYLQLAAHIRQLISTQRLIAGNQLPSSRKLAKLLSISRTSTLNAYDQLIAEGILITRPSAGIFVSQLKTKKSATIEQAPSSQRPLPTEQIPSGFFESGPDIEQFPAAEWARSLARVWRHPDSNLLRHVPQGGYWPLRETVSRYLKAVRNLECEPEQVIITAGSRDSMTLIAEALSLSGKEVALENPCYPLLKHSLKTLGAQLSHIDVDKQGMQVPAAPMSLAWMSAARQYPLGLPMSTERRLAWLEYSQQHNCWLVEDDYDAEFQYHKPPLAPLFSMAKQQYPDDRQTVIFVGSFSKLMFRTLRIGYLIVPPALISSFLQAQSSLGNLANIPIQPALADFISHRRFASHLRRMRRCYQQRRDFLHALLSQQLGDQLEVELPESGMHLLAHIKNHSFDWDDRYIEQRLASQGIYAPALSAHYANNPQQGLLLGFSGAAEELLSQGVTQLKTVMERAK
ncbi:MAG: PLP-dependent aminotransferase family protein [Oceanospirillaceae bacterium]|nr:PLP-dependent aminotransferase family protein [Oceanospirillaceae bacterium]